MAPRFLDLEIVLEIHRDLIATYGGSDGLRDRGLLESALAMPGAGMGGELFHPTLHEMAAAYLFHLVKNHPFVDGNKRTASVVACTFLEANGATFTSSGRTYEKAILAVAEGKMDKAALAEFFRKHLRARSRPQP